MFLFPSSFYKLSFQFQETSAKNSSKDLPQKEDEAPRILNDVDLVFTEDAKTEKLDTVVQKPCTDLTESPTSLTCKSSVAVGTDSAISENDESKECRTVVSSLPSQPAKKLVTTETQTDTFISQIDGLPTPSDSEDRNNDDHMTFASNKPLVYTPILPAPVIDSDSDVDISKNDGRTESPTTSSSQTDNSNEYTVEAVPPPRETSDLPETYR